MRNRDHKKPRNPGINLVGVLSLVGLVALAACDAGAGEEATSMEMTPEEHARMQSGGQGKVDSTGAAVRQPVHLTAGQERALGVVYLTVESRALEWTIRTVGRVMAAEDKVADVTLKIDGFVEDLYVNTTGEAVRRGQPLLTLYSPELVVAQEELLTAKRLASRVDESVEEAWRSAQTMLEAARRRLSYWDITDEQIAQIEEVQFETQRGAITARAEIEVLKLDLERLWDADAPDGDAIHAIVDQVAELETSPFEQGWNDLEGPFSHVGSFNADV